MPPVCHLKWSNQDCTLCGEFHPHEYVGLFDEWMPEIKFVSCASCKKAWDDGVKDEWRNLYSKKNPPVSVDNVNHPAHYNSGKIEVMEFIEDQKLDFNAGNVVKYICRAGKKAGNKESQDLRKALFYLRRKIYLLECAEKGLLPVPPNAMAKDTL